MLAVGLFMSSYTQSCMIFADTRLTEKSYDISFFKTTNYTAFKDVLNPPPKPNTCLWFLENPIFHEWMKSGTGRILWLTADPGCGKSVLSRALIDVTFPMQTDRTTVYFFFKDDGIQMDICVAMCAMIHQLLCQKPHLFNHATETIVQNGATIKDDFDQLWQLFMKLISERDCGPVICLLDGLDECQKTDRGRLTSKLHEFFTVPSAEPQCHNEGLRFFIASRPYSDIARSFATVLSQARLLRLDANAEQKKINMEIGSVIRAEMEQYSSSLPLSGEQVQTAIDAILAYENRNYLWVACIFKEINDAEPASSAELMQVIRQLPDSLQSAYNRILMRCPDRQRTLNILGFIVAAKRPLEISELDVMLALLGQENVGRCWYANLHQHIAGPDARMEQVRQQCGFFVRIDGSAVHLIHQTAREFLVQRDDGLRSDTRWQHCIRLSRAHELFADICIRFLLLRDFEIKDELDPWRFSGQHNAKGAYKKKRDTHEFYHYADRNWASHYRESHVDPHHPLHLLAKRLYFPNDSAPCLWLLDSLLRHEKRYATSAESYLPPRNAFEVLCLDEHIVLLAQIDLKVIPQTTLDRALRLACEKGHSDVVTLLLKVADQHEFLDGKANALQTAVSNQHLDVANLLLEAGARVNQRADLDVHSESTWATETALYIALLVHCKGIVYLLLRHGADVHAHSGRFVSCLHALLDDQDDPHFDQCCEVTQLCLDFGADVNLKDINGDTPLHLACRLDSRLDVVQCLMKAGANPNVTNEAGRTPLFGAIAIVEEGLDSMDWEIFQWMLEDDRVDLNIKDQGGHNMLAFLVSTDMRGSLEDYLYQDLQDMIRTLLFCDRLVIDFDCDGTSGFERILMQTVTNSPGSVSACLKRIRTDGLHEQTILQRAHQHATQCLVAEMGLLGGQGFPWWTWTRAIELRHCILAIDKLQLPGVQSPRSHASSYAVGVAQCFDGLLNQHLCLAQDAQERGFTCDRCQHGDLQEGWYCPVCYVSEAFQLLCSDCGKGSTDLHTNCHHPMNPFDLRDMFTENWIDSSIAAAQSAIEGESEAASLEISSKARTFVLDWKD